MTSPCRAKREQKKVEKPCHHCGQETSCSVIYEDGTHTRRCDKCRAMSTLVRPDQARELAEAA
jgi:hypothetical protein